jgi:hypothetical protein
VGLRSVPALAIVAAIAVWSALSVVNAFGSGSGAASASHGYQYFYGYAKSVDGKGTINGPNGSVRFSVHAVSDARGTIGSCQVEEPGTKIRCLDLGPILAGGNAAQLTGTATINGALTNFTIVVTDNGSPGAGKDTFSIETSSGYVRGGVLASGNVKIAS